VVVIQHREDTTTRGRDSFQIPQQLLKALDRATYQFPQALEKKKWGWQSGSSGGTLLSKREALNSNPRTTKK
jgi:hypothetical protein